MAQIAIIGTQGAGKTVFLSVLAMRYRSPRAGQPWLEWKNRETQLYVAETWDTLARQEWPASTGSTKDRIFPLLNWELHSSPNQKHPLRVIDSVGQDVRAVFESKRDEWTEPQKNIQLELVRANVVLFLVNLREVIDATSQGKIDEVEIPIKLAVESAVRRGACFALLLSQHDSFASHLAQVGIAPDDPRAALEHFLPQLAGILSSMQDDRAVVFYIAAVAETVPIADDKGTMWRRPKPGFKSEGLDAVLKWTVGVLPVIESKLDEKRSLLDAKIRVLIGNETELNQRLNRLAQVEPPEPFKALTGTIAFVAWIAFDVAWILWGLTAAWFALLGTWVVGMAIRKAAHEEKIKAHQGAMRELADLKDRQALVGEEIGGVIKERERLH